MDKTKIKSVWKSDLWNSVPKWKLKWWDFQVYVELLFLKLKQKCRKPKQM